MSSFMTGDKVRLIDNFRTRGDHKKHPEYYPEPGTVGTVYQDSAPDGTTLVEWPQAAIRGPRSDWWAPSADLEVVSHALSVEEDKDDGTD